jgi:hypothetical protein
MGHHSNSWLPITVGPSVRSHVNGLPPNQRHQYHPGAVGGVFVQRVVTVRLVPSQALRVLAR